MIMNSFPKQTYYNKYVYVRIKLQQMQSISKFQISYLSLIVAKINLLPHLTH